MENDLYRSAQSLEDEFFLREDQRLMESLREMRALEETTGLLAEVSGIKDPGLLRHLAELKVTPAVATSLAILPLIEVAWADGKVEPNESEAILASLDRVLFFQTIDRDIVESWLTHKPRASLFSAWEAYARDLCTRLSGEERRHLADEILAQARVVAQAAGSVLGFGGISKSEQAVLDRLGQALA